MLAASLLGAPAIVRAQCSITDLGALNGGSESVAFRVSADGNVVVGWARDGAAHDAIRAFRWTAASGMQSLGVINGGWRSFALDVSADGSVIVGYATDGKANNRTRAFRWAQAAGMTTLGAFPGSKYPEFVEAFAYGVSADGKVVAGYAQGPASGDGYRVFRWTQAGGMQNVGVLDEKYDRSVSGSAGWARAFGISADGRVIVGEASNRRTPGNSYPPIRWDEATGMQASGPASGSAYGVSGDGKVIAGYLYRSGDNAVRAFRWTESAGVHELGVLKGGLGSRAFGVSTDGKVVVGHADDGNVNRAFRWTEVSGMQTLEDWLSTNGADLAGNVPKVAYGANRDGSVVVGQLASDRAFIARCGAVEAGATGPGTDEAPGAAPRSAQPSPGGAPPPPSPPAALDSPDVDLISTLSVAGFALLLAGLILVQMRRGTFRMQWTGIRWAGTLTVALLTAVPVLYVIGRMTLNQLILECLDTQVATIAPGNGAVERKASLACVESRAGMVAKAVLYLHSDLVAAAPSRPCRYVGTWSSSREGSLYLVTLKGDGHWTSERVKDDRRASASKVASGTWSVEDGKMEWRYDSGPVPLRDINEIIFTDDRHFTLVEINGQRTDFIRIDGTRTSACPE